MKLVFFFGDSIAFGASDKEGGWIERIRKDISRHNIDSNYDPYYISYNLSIPGTITSSLIRTLNPSIDERMRENDEIIIIIAIGINDSTLLIDNNRNYITSSEFKENIEKLISYSIEYKAKIIFIGLTPVDTDRINKENNWDPNMQYRNEEIQKYNKIIKDMCMENSLYFIDLYKILDKRTYIREYLEDGLHPNTKGYQRIYQIIKEYLIQESILEIN